MCLYYFLVNYIKHQFGTFVFSTPKMRDFLVSTVGILVCLHVNISKLLLTYCESLHQAFTFMFLAVITKGIKLGKVGQKQG